MSLFDKAADYLIRRAKRTPYSHIINGVGVTSNPADADYMERYWLFNAYDANDGKGKRFKFLPSIRIHRIKKSDDDRALHDHPWGFVTVILKGGYYEVRPIIKEVHLSEEDGLTYVVTGHETTWHGPGSILIRKASDFHRLIVPEGGEAWTMFTTGKYVQRWGFLWNDYRKMAYDKYLALFGKGQ